MRRQTVLTIFLLAVLTFSWSAASVHASSVNYVVHDGEVSVKLALSLFQNATAMPSLNEKFTGVAAQSLTSAIEESLKSEVGNASISALSGELRSSGDWINASIQFDVTGVASQSGGILNVNCSWVRFKVSNDLKLGDVSYNLIGARYVRPEFESYADYREPPLNETIKSVMYRVGQEDTDARLAIQSAGNVTLLDFSNLFPPIEKWIGTYNATKGSATWAYNGAPATDLRMTVIPREGAQFVVHAFYKYNATLSVDGPAQAHSDVITTEVAGSYETLLMLIVVVATFVVAVVASWIYRSRRKQLPRRRK